MHLENRFSATNISKFESLYQPYCSFWLIRCDRIVKKRSRKEGQFQDYLVLLTAEMVPCSSFEWQVSVFFSRIDKVISWVVYVYLVRTKKEFFKKNIRQIIRGPPENPCIRATQVSVQGRGGGPAPLQKGVSVPGIGGWGVQRRKHGVGDTALQVK